VICYNVLHYSQKAAPALVLECYVLKLTEGSVFSISVCCGQRIVPCGWCIANMKNYVSVFGKNVISNGSRQLHHGRFTDFNFSCALWLLPCI
jgi:hypothetical protein